MDIKNGKTVIVAAFPGSGKSYTYVNYNKIPYTISDSDSSKFSWIYENGVKTDKRNPNFVDDYITHIKSLVGKKDIIFVSTHSDILHRLNEEQMDFILLRPSTFSQEVWEKRFRDRGSSEEFITQIIGNWDKYMCDMDDVVKKCKHCVLTVVLPPYYVDPEQLSRIIIGNVTSFKMQRRCSNALLPNPEIEKKDPTYIVDGIPYHEEWMEFRNSGLLWFINNILHLFGWAICITVDNCKIVEVVPKRVNFRGFSQDRNTKGYKQVTEYLKENIDSILHDVEE